MPKIQLRLIDVVFLFGLAVCCILAILAELGLLK